MSARFEIIRTDAPQPWHARFRAANGRIVWTTENYTRRGHALNAIKSFIDPMLGCWVDKDHVERDGKWVDVDAVMHRNDHWNKTDKVRLEIRDVDERAEVTP